MSTTSSSKGGGGRKYQRQSSRSANSPNDRSKPQKQTKPNDIPDETEERPANRSTALILMHRGDSNGPAPAKNTKDSETNSAVSVASEEVSSEGGRWQPIAPGRIRKTGGMRKESHSLPQLQIGPVDPNKDKISRDKAAAQELDNPFDGGEFNAHINERLSRVARGTGAPPPGMNRGIPKNELVARFENESTDKFEAEWRRRPEVPTTKELLREDVYLPGNIIDGPYDSVDEYLEAHYELLREDAFGGLRDAVAHVRENPESNDTQDISIYENVRVLGLTFSHMGVACKVSFSINRAGKNIRWKNSKRLIPGTLVCVSDDNFQTIKVATVAARPMVGLESNPPEVDLLFHETELEIDTEKEMVMVESRNGYFEAYKWTLKALQRMTEDNFALHEHICFLDQNVPPPDYVRKNPIYNISSIFPDIPDKEALEDINVTREWPPDMKTSMDKSQMTALKSILTKRLSIVQGPPGTGKTFVSVQALHILLENMREGDPPIIVACQTNHALGIFFGFLTGLADIRSLFTIVLADDVDQLLDHVLQKEKEIVRLGGRTQDTDKIKERTIFELRKGGHINIQGSQYNLASAKMKILRDKMVKLLEPLKQELLTSEDFYELGFISPTQAKSFSQRSAGWVVVEENEKPGGFMGQWLGEYFVEIQTHEPIENEYEEGDIEYETLKEIEQEYHAAEDHDDTLKGFWFAMGREYTVLKPVGVSPAEIQQAMMVENVWDLEEYLRAAIYHHLRQRVMNKIWEEVKSLNKEYQNFAQMLRVSKLEKDAHIIAGSKLVGMTTTGLGKYRSIIAAVKPRIVLIEEAAEALEGPVAIACMPSVEHLILVGDHKQLRPHCSVNDLSEDPYFLDISMFERLVDNKFPFETLRTQRRMRPEIREILYPIYEDTLVDHDCVLGRESIQGMGDTNVYWYSHEFIESKDEVSSRMNINEATMIVSFADYLILNGALPEKITILTFYAGQKAEIYRQIRKNINLAHTRLKVATVDGYQGEENEIILLSLVRSNDFGSIGFLSIQNRVCVALSRARRGFYIFGNAKLITQADPLWWQVANILNEPPARIGVKLPLTCMRHKNKTLIEDPLEWIDINGGCSKFCKEGLPCGHTCILKCHSFEHKMIRCLLKCSKTLPCGHQCCRDCWEECVCPRCGRDKKETAVVKKPGRSTNPSVTAPPAVAAIENRQNEYLPPRPATTNKPPVTPKLVEIDEWEAALPGNQSQPVVTDRDEFPEMSRGTHVSSNNNHSHHDHPQNYPQNSNHQNNHRDSYYNGNNPNPNPGQPIRGGGVYGVPRRNVNERWPDEDENGQVIDDRVAGARRGGHNQWGNRGGYPAQEQRANEAWPTLGGGNPNNPTRSQNSRQIDGNNAWSRNSTPNHKPPGGGEPRDGFKGGDRGQSNPRGRGGNLRKPVSYTAYR